MNQNEMLFDGRLPFVLNTIGECQKQQAMVREIGPAWNQFIWVKSGEGRFNIAGDTVYLGEGKGMFMRCRVPHSYARSGSSFHTVYFTFFSSDNLIDYTIGDASYLVFDVPDFLENETAMLTALARSSATTLELSATGYTYVTELFAAITKNGDSVINRVRELMENRCDLPLTLDEIAAKADMDKYALCRYFKKHHSKSVMDELKSIRIKKAKRLLRYSSDSIEAIGIACGFSSPSYFALRFREECGCSPTEYRNSRM